MGAEVGQVHSGYRCIGVYDLYRIQGLGCKV